MTAKEADENRFVEGIYPLCRPLRSLHCHMRRIFFGGEIVNINPK